jgi:DMSO/TMAO reductase YedYZ molybdopterin-dependent catalytic subunit
LALLKSRVEPIARTIRVSSTAALAGFVPHYLAFYALATPLYTDRIAEWIMARMPSRYAVAILEHLGGWAKPWACTGGLAALGFILFIARLAGSFSPAKWRVAVVILSGLPMAMVLTWSCGYESFLGSAALWAQALAITAFWPFEQQLPTWAVQMGRRNALAALMGAGVVAVAGESFLRNERLARRAKQPVDLFPFEPPPDRQMFGAGLVRKNVTPTAEFYGMSKDTVDPVVDPKSWRLTVSVEGRPIRRYTYAELLALPRQLRYVTLRCISNTLKSDLMGTAEWAGVTFSQLADRRILPPEIVEVVLLGAEGHDDSLKIEYAFGPETLLALGMNGKTLSRTHGFPIRLLAPRYYGCRNVKWIREIDFVSRSHPGTWQRLGYTDEPVVHIVSHIDRMRRDGQYIEFGGVSFAGSSGIRAVRVRADRRPWQPAILEPALSPYTWTRWTARLVAPLGALLEVNAQDGSGRWQALVKGNPFPSGLTGPTVVAARV